MLLQVLYAVGPELDDLNGDTEGSSSGGVGSSATPYRRGTPPQSGGTRCFVRMAGSYLPCSAMLCDNDTVQPTALLRNLPLSIAATHDVVMVRPTCTPCDDSWPPPCMMLSWYAPRTPHDDSWHTPCMTLSRYAPHAHPVMTHGPPHA